MDHGLTLRILHLGNLETDTAVMLPGRDDGGRLTLPVCAYLISDSKGEHILVDTGMHDGHVSDPHRTWRGTANDSAITPRMTAADTLVHALDDLGLNASHIGIVINTHFHFDHVGNNHLFPHAQVIAQHSHLAAVTQRPDSFPVPVDRANVAAVDGEYAVRPGVTVFPTPGHVVGHQSVLVELDNMPGVIIAGDAIPFAASFEFDDWDAHDDPARARATARELVAFAERRGATLLFSHDAGQLGALPRTFR